MIYNHDIIEQLNEENDIAKSIVQLAISSIEHSIAMGYISDEKIFEAREALNRLNDELNQLIENDIFIDKIHYLYHRAETLGKLQ